MPRLLSVATNSFPTRQRLVTVPQLPLVASHTTIAASPTHSPAASLHLPGAVSPPPPSATAASPRILVLRLIGAATNFFPTRQCLVTVPQLPPTAPHLPRHCLPNAFVHRFLSPSTRRRLPTTSRNRRLLFSPEPSCSTSSSALLPIPSPITLPTSGMTLGDSSRWIREKGAR